MELQIGQCWSYENREGEDDSTLIILEIEEFNDYGDVVFVYVDGLKLENPEVEGGYSSIIRLMPFLKDSLLPCLKKLITVELDALPEFGKAYEYWLMLFNKGKAGILSSTVAEAITIIESGRF